MKFNININQVALADSPLDVSDAAILDYLCHLCMSTSPTIDRHRVYGYAVDPETKQRSEKPQAWTWVDYKHLIKEMPLLRLKSGGAVSRRIANIEEAGYISTKRVGNQRLYIRLEPKADELFTNSGKAIHENEQLGEPFTKVNRAVDKNEQLIYKKDHNTKNNKYTSADVEFIHKHYCKVFKKSPAQYALTDQRKRKIGARLNDAGKDILVSAIDKAHADEFYGGKTSKWSADLDWIVNSYERVEKMANLSVAPVSPSHSPTLVATTVRDRSEESPEEYAKARAKAAEVRKKLRRH